MTRYVLLDEYSIELSTDFQKGPLIDDISTKRFLAEKKIGYINAKLEVSLYSNEIEPPHFNIKFQGENCRFRLDNGEPMDTMGPHISKYKNNIKKYYKDKRHWLCEIYNDNLPTDAPPQARITF